MGRPKSGRLLSASRLWWFAAVVLIYVPLREVAQISGPFATAVCVIALVLLLGVVTLSWRTIRVEWDGQQVVWRSAFMRRTVGTPGTGQIVRAAVAGAAADGPAQYWMDDGGRAVGRFTEALWDPSALRRIAEQARIPILELGSVTPRELSERYPSILPRRLVR